MALCILLAACTSNGPGPVAVAYDATSAPSHRIYCIRGVLNVFSQGIDDLCGKLRDEGLTVTVRNHLFWPSLAEEAAADYRSGRARTIILVGHSAGAAAVTRMSNSLGRQGIPVRLGVELDPVWTTTASGQVDMLVTYYVGDGAGVPVRRGPAFEGTLTNIDVSSYPGMGHLTIDKYPLIHEAVFALIRQALADPGESAVAGDSNTRLIAQQ